MSSDHDDREVVLDLERRFWNAMKAKDGKTAAWVIDPQTRKVSLREIRVGKYREDGVSVISGLMPSDWVVTAGVLERRRGHRPGHPRPT